MAGRNVLFFLKSETSNMGSGSPGVLSNLFTCEAALKALSRPLSWFPALRFLRTLGWFRGWMLGFQTHRKLYMFFADLTHSRLLRLAEAAKNTLEVLVRHPRIGDAAPVGYKERTSKLRFMVGWLAIEESAISTWSQFGQLPRSSSGAMRDIVQGGCCFCL